MAAGDRATPADDEKPQQWPGGVREITWHALGKLGVRDSDNTFWWDGNQVETRVRLASTERVLAIIGAGSAVAIVVIEAGRSIGSRGG